MNIGFPANRNSCHEGGERMERSVTGSCYELRVARPAMMQSSPSRVALRATLDRGGLGLAAHLVLRIHSLRRASGVELSRVHGAWQAHQRVTPIMDGSHADEDID